MIGFDPAKLVYDDEPHTYTYDGTPQLSVSRVIELAGFVDKRWFSGFARDRGTYAHRAIELLDQNDLDESTVDPVLLPYVDAWRTFCHDAGAKWTHIEMALCDPTRGFAGRLDRVGEVFGELAIVDAKTGAHLPYHEIQVKGGYARLAESCGIAPSARRLKCYGVYITADGTYKVQAFTNPTALAVFDAARVVAQWKLANLTISQQEAA